MSEPVMQPKRLQATPSPSVGALLGRAVALLLPFFDTERNRQAILRLALADHPDRLDEVNWAGNSKTFTRNLVTQLHAYGDLEPGRPALVIVMETVRTDVGLDRQAAIDAWIADYGALGAAGLDGTANVWLTGVDGGTGKRSQAYLAGWFGRLRRMDRTEVAKRLATGYAVSRGALGSLADEVLNEQVVWWVPVATGLGATLTAYALESGAMWPPDLLAAGAYLVVYALVVLFAAGRTEAGKASWLVWAHCGIAGMAGLGALAFSAVYFNRYGESVLHMAAYAVRVALLVSAGLALLPAVRAPAVRAFVSGGLEALPLLVLAGFTYYMEQFYRGTSLRPGSLDVYVGLLAVAALALLVYGGALLLRSRLRADPLGGPR